MSHILNLVTEIAETNQAKAIDAKFAKTRENSENRLFLKFWKYQDLRPIFAAWSISELIQVICCL